MAYDFARPGPALHGYSIDTSLGYQQIRPLLLDALSDRLQSHVVEWQYVKFVEANWDQVPDQAGIYFFIVHPHAASIEYHSIILYFGKAKSSLRSRFRDYIGERDGVSKTDREHVRRMLSIYKNRVYFAHCCFDTYDVEKLEDMLIDAFSPCCNVKTPKSQPAF